MEEGDSGPKKPVGFIRPVINPLKENELAIKENVSVKKNSPVLNKSTENEKPETPKKSVDKKVAREIKYKTAEHQNLSEFLKKNVPKELTPTNRTGYILGFIYLAVVIIALLQFPLNQLLAGKTDITISVGIPMDFLVFEAMNPLKLPLRFGGLIVDLIIYLFIAYLIDVLIGAFFSSLKKVKEEKERPKVFKTGKKKSFFGGGKVKESVVEKKSGEEKVKKVIIDTKKAQTVEKKNGPLIKESGVEVTEV